LNITCGITKTIQLIIKHSSLQFDHHVMTFGGDGFERFRELGITPSVINYDQNSIIASFKFFLQLYRFIKKNNINIVHSHHRYFDLQSFFVSKILNIRTLTSVQSKVYGHKVFSYKSEKLIACSLTIKNHLIEEFHKNANRIIVVNNFVDPSEVTRAEDLRGKLGIPEKATLLGFFGRLSFKEKGVDILLNSFKNLSIRNDNIYLLLVGKGSDSEAINQIIKKESLRAVLLSPQTEIFNLYDITDIVVLPSRVEPFGIIIIESGLMKKPFIGSKIDGIQEIIIHGENGLLFETGNSEELELQIEAILKNPTFAKELGINLYKKVKKYYTPAKILPKYEKLYSELINA